MTSRDLPHKRPPSPTDLSQHRALMLLYLEDRSYREIAEVLGITETNVATKINRLKQRIRTGIAED